MAEVLVKTHLVVTDVHEEYDINWCGRILDVKPKIKNNMPVFVVVSSRGRMEVNTTDMQRVERCAKLLTAPRGRQAVTTDTARIFIVEENENEALMGVLTHNHVKSYAPMFDKVDFV
ncbi:hypothetical protein [Megamonas funiformis]|uniref:hypothetical protein n=1 Tax=Megamonas funiformis TaxID=437897 RepID=UPI003F83A1B4